MTVCGFPFPAGNSAHFFGRAASDYPRMVRRDRCWRRGRAGGGMRAGNPSGRTRGRPGVRACGPGRADLGAQGQACRPGRVVQAVESRVFTPGPVTVPRAEATRDPAVNAHLVWLEQHQMRYPFGAAPPPLRGRPLPPPPIAPRLRQPLAARPGNKLVRKFTIKGWWGILGWVDRTTRNAGRIAAGPMIA